MKTTMQHVDDLIAKHKKAEADKNNPPIPSKRRVRIIATFTVNETDLVDLQVYDIFKECLPEVLTNNLIDVRVELI